MNPLRKLKRYLIYKLKKKVNIDHKSEVNNFSIDELFKYFGTDKGSYWKNENTKGHGYSQFYEKHLNIFRNRKINILEIGSFSGASAASFIKYFPLSTVYCLDVNPTNFLFISKKIKVFCLDVSNQKMIKEFYKKINIKQNQFFFDIIIDDGSHKLSDIIISLNAFFMNLKPGGYYILEDYKFPNYYSHLNDCDENKVDEILNFIKDKKEFKSNLLTDSMIKYISDNTQNVFTHKGFLKDSDIAFIKKLD